MVLSIQCFKKQTKISKQKQRKGALKERGCFFWYYFTQRFLLIILTFMMHLQKHFVHVLCLVQICCPFIE